MRGAAVSILLAGAITLAVYPRLLGPLPPPRCGTVEAGGAVIQSFCINYDPALGRYETPPSGVPADFALVRPGEYPDPLPIIVALFAGLAVILTLSSRLLPLIWQRAMRSRPRVGSPVPPG